MKRITHKVDADNIKNIPEEYRQFVKEEMTNAEMGILGMIILKDKFAKFKHELFGWYYERKTKKNNK